MSGEADRKNRLAEAYSREHYKECVCGGDRWFKVPVQELFGTPVPCYCVLRERDDKKPAKLREQSGVMEGYSVFSFRNFSPAKALPLDGMTARETADYMAYIKEVCQEFVVLVREGRTRWLLLCGPVGSGKTHLAAAIANALLEANVPVIIDNTVSFLGMMQAGFRDGTYRDRVETLCRVDVLVLDDFGVESPTPWAKERLYEIVEFRSRNRLPTVFTSNIMLSDLSDPRLRSRILEGVHTPEGLVRMIVFKCGDYRQQASINDFTKEKV